MDDTLNMKPEDRIEYWNLVMSDFKESGLTRREYCKENDIKVSTFDYWKRRLSDINAYAETEGSRFAELKLSSGDMAGKYSEKKDPVSLSVFNTEMVVTVGNVSLCINSSTPVALITRIISELSLAK